ncbi:MAG: hypothetical protein J7K30_12510 [Deltaproteobacteria bacterium]|nr:hypothetical protein [Deltaproteobacteria bacterium]
MDIVDELSPLDIFIIPACVDRYVPLHEIFEDLHWVDIFWPCAKFENRVII